MAGVDACTIVSRRALARARVLVASFHEHHPQARFTVFLLDGEPGVEELGAARVEHVDDALGAESRLTILGNPPAAAGLALLPALMRSLLQRGDGPLVYLDAGLRVLAPLDGLRELGEQHELVLVARVAGGERASDTPAFSAPLGGGAFSHRVLGVKAGEGTERVLASWPRWFANDGPALYAWFDTLAATAGDRAVLSSPGYGLDSSTLASWAPGSREDRLEVGGQQARLFDFTDLDPHAPERYLDLEQALSASEVPALATLCRLHARELLEAGYEADAARAESLDRLPDGTRLMPVSRRLLVELVQQGKLTEAPLGEQARASFYEELNEPAERGSDAGLTRLHLAIWESREDLRAAYPELGGPDGLGFAGWLCVHGPEQEGLTRELLPPAPPTLHRDTVSNLHQREPLWGVNVAGFFTSELGLGEAARLLIAGLDASGVPALPVQAQLVPPCRQEAEFTYADPDQAAYSTNIVCMNGDSIAPFAREVGSSFFEGRYTIALWWWEVGEFPSGWEDAFEHIDEVWVASSHIYDAIAPASPVPVVRMTLPAVTPRVAARTRAQLGMPEEGFLFLFVHDYHSTAARKNPVGTIEAFKRAFPHGSGAKLVLKSINAGNLPHEHDRVLLAAGDHPDIRVIDAYVSAAEKNAMIDACDCYVSLHRSEGFGLTVAEAMLLGKPVIATRYGGTLEFTTEENAYLVDWTPVAVGEGAHPYPASGVWADPDIEQAAELMREVFADPAAARERGAQGRRDVHERHAPAVAGEAMRSRLRLIHDRRVEAGARALSLPHMPAIEFPELPEMIDNEPPVEGSGVGGAAKRGLRRRLSALMRPQLGRQRAINWRLLDSVARADARLLEVARTLEQQQEARFAESLALVRRLKGEVADALAQAADARDATAALEALEPGPRLAALEELGRQLEQHLAEHRALPYVSEEREFEQWRDPLAGHVTGYRSADADARPYFDFEATFRGPEGRVRELQRSYLPLLSGRAPVLDVGFGRGELLDLLREDGIEARGVDADADMVDHARAKGLEVTLATGNEHLRGLEEGSLGSIVALELVEHLPYEELMEFLALARSRLREDGILLVETVNPHAVHAMKAFWVDPTHQHPIFPEVALELCRVSGFAEAFWFHPTGGGSFDADRQHQPIYAVAASPGMTASAASRGATAAARPSATPSAAVTAGSAASTPAADGDEGRA
jgi:glycosyltransferase involved in cell wall biosynthesis/2-polyprenyl-3-methyl-5-hydroxy-6-metoxy-1,4-benzoquinol methylase